MTDFRTDGAYIKMQDDTKEGYYTEEENGKLIKHKYNIIDKIFDIVKYGKIQAISYSYIYFSESMNKSKGILLHMGSMVSELTNLLSYLSHRTYFEDDCQECFYKDEGIIKYYDKNNKVCSITAIRDAMLVILNAYSYYDNQNFVEEYQFCSFPRW